MPAKLASVKPPTSSDPGICLRMLNCRIASIEMAKIAAVITAGAVNSFRNGRRVAVGEIVSCAFKTRPYKRKRSDRARNAAGPVRRHRLSVDNVLGEPLSPFTGQLAAELVVDHQSLLVPLVGRREHARQLRNFRRQLGA